MDEKGEAPIRLRVEAGASVELGAGRYEVSVVVPEHLRRPGLGAYWLDEPVKITYRDA